MQPQAGDATKLQDGGRDDPFRSLQLHPLAPRELIERVYWHLAGAAQKRDDEIAAAAEVERLNTAYQSLVDAMRDRHGDLLPNPTREPRPKSGYGNGSSTTQHANGNGKKRGLFGARQFTVPVHEPDAYETLRIDRDASDEVLQISYDYRRGQLRGSPQFVDELERVERAYEQLGEPEARATYDRMNPLVAAEPDFVARLRELIVQPAEVEGAVSDADAVARTEKILRIAQDGSGEADANDFAVADTEGAIANTTANDTRATATPVEGRATTRDHKRAAQRDKTSHREAPKSNVQPDATSTQEATVTLDDEVAPAHAHDAATEAPVAPSDSDATSPNVIQDRLDTVESRDDAGVKMPEPPALDAATHDVATKVAPSVVDDFDASTHDETSAEDASVASGDEVGVPEAQESRPTRVGAMFDSWRRKNAASRPIDDKERAPLESQIDADARPHAQVSRANVEQAEQDRLMGLRDDSIAPPPNPIASAAGEATDLRLEPDEPASAYLTFITGMRSGESLALNGDTVTLGTSPRSSVILPDHAGTIAREHARIWRHAGNYLLREVDGTGTLIGGASLPAPVVVLEDGDEIQIGLYRMQFSVPRDDDPGTPETNEQLA